jgi:hypothetical protein
MGTGDWGLGTRGQGDWGLGTGDWGQGDKGTGDWGLGTGDWGIGKELLPMPNAQCPMPNAPFSTIIIFVNKRRKFSYGLVTKTFWDGKTG